MSVIAYEPDQYQKLLNTLYQRYKMYPVEGIRCLDKNLVMTQAKYFFDGDEDKAYAQELARFVRMMYYANHMAYEYTYSIGHGEIATIQPLHTVDPVCKVFNKSELFTIPELVKFLVSLEYNCIANSGSNFIPFHAQEILARVFGNCANLLAELLLKSEEERKTLVDIINAVHEEDEKHGHC